MDDYVEQIKQFSDEKRPQNINVASFANSSSLLK